MAVEVHKHQTLQTLEDDKKMDTPTAIAISLAYVAAAGLTLILGPLPAAAVVAVGLASNRLFNR